MPPKKKQVVRTILRIGCGATQRRVERERRKNLAEEPVPEVLDCLERLYVVPIYAAPGTIEVKDLGQTLAVLWSGEALFYGAPQDDGLKIETLRRLALYGRILPHAGDESLQQRFGLISLNGPTAPVDPDRPDEPLQMTLHYTELSFSPDHPPLHTRADAFYPKVEHFTARLHWQPVLAAAENETVYFDTPVPPAPPQPAPPYSAAQPPYSAAQPPYSAAATTSGPAAHLWLSDFHIQGRQKVVGDLTLAPILVYPLAVQGSQPTVFDNAPAPDCLPVQCAEPPTPAAAPDGTVMRLLPLRFIDFTSRRDLARIETICGALLNDQQGHGLCPVWRRKAALQFDIDPLVADGSDELRARFHAFDAAQALGLSQVVVPPNPAYNKECIRVFLVDTLPVEFGAGVAYNCPQASAFIVIGVDDLLPFEPQPDLIPVLNRNLLAHELGHILGLDHSGLQSANGLLPGSPGSIADPCGWEDACNPSKNTRHNFEIFAGWSYGTQAGSTCMVQPNPLLRTTTLGDGFFPDPE